MMLLLILLPGPTLLLTAGLLIAAVLLEVDSAALAKTELRLLLGICIHNLTFVRSVFLNKLLIKWIDFDI